MSFTKKETVCQEADRLTGSDRVEAYGHPKINFDDIARMWTVILRDILKPGAKISLTHVGLCNVATKICRHIAHPKRDNLVDMAGYANTIEAVENPDPLRQIVEDEEVPDIEPVPEYPSDIDSSPESKQRADVAWARSIHEHRNRIPIIDIGPSPFEDYKSNNRRLLQHILE